MLSHPLAMALAVAFFCGALAATATWVRQRRQPDTLRPGVTALGAGLVTMIGALIGIAIAQALFS